MNTLKFFPVALFFLFLSSCQQPSPKKISDLDCKSILALNDILTNAIIQDAFSPPVSSRIYAYANIAAYESLCALDKNCKSFGGQLNELETLSLKDNLTGVDPEIVVITAFSEVAKKLVFTYQIVDKGRDSLIHVYSGNTDTEHSQAIGKKVAEHILAWVKTDKYKETRNMPMHPVTDDPAAWQPTAPAYGEAIEPHWNKIRPFTLKSADQFKPKPPVEFSTDTSSAFYKMAYENYEVRKIMNDSLLTITKFWDCNPMPMTQIGHMMYVRKQLSPGGHWIKIAGNACKQQEHNLLESSRVLSLVAITIADAFISCWDEKYRSNLIRPETYIAKYIDSNWKPVLQTPAFPEHTSGHSVVSSASATMLTNLFGDNFAYIDSAEVFLGLPAMPFTSFREAAKTAAMSRFYGGIHYMPAIEYGIEQGNQIGEWVWKQIDVNQK